ncbi:unnamed protein product [Phytophthora fragariaefolia]|uniref:Unnamed protein product n=1 Tax=Phytophthora fragariaefolia TaxID=1490495 RepID=A0A9W7D3I3_9STRA|nr:unnamed protein product [Phytophthora fragariaefolia]
MCARELTAQASQAAQASVRDGDAASSVCQIDTVTGENRRGPECLDVYGYWSPVSEDGAREPSDTSVGVDLTSSYELVVFRLDLHDGRIERICILTDVERMECEAEELKQLLPEGADAFSAKSKKERFDEQSWGSLKSSPLYEFLREYKDVLPGNIPAELPQDKWA